jgi:TolB-like protein/Tfp pilus assembly protein PilF
MSKPSTLVYEFGPFRVDAAQHLLLRDGVPVPLTPKAFDTLLVLVENSGRLVEKDNLMKEIWPDSFVEEGSLTRNISVLRKVLGGDSADTRYIETLPKRGYRFTVSVSQFEGEELLVRRHTQVRIVTEEDVDEPEEISATKKKLSLPEAVRSLAVLPFKLLGGDLDDEYLGLGIADALITKLSNIRRITVRPTSAVLNFTGLTQDAASSGRQLQVDAVLEGSIQRINERIRVTVQLVGVEEGAPLWGERFDEKFTHIFEVEDRVSEQVVTALTSKLSGEESRLLLKRYTEDSEAYRSYLQGRYFWNKRTPEGLSKAVEFFREAIGRDPDYALAYAGLADCYNISGFWMYLPPKEAFPQARAAAAEAIKLDDTLAEAHVSFAWAVLHYEWDRATAEKEYRLAIELNPGYVTAHQWYALFLMQAARFDEASRELKRAHEIDPLSLAVSFNIGLLLVFAGRYDEAIEQLKRTIELEPNYFIARNFLALSYSYKSMFEECIAEYQRCVNLLRASGNVAALGVGYAITGQHAEARALLGELEDRVSHPYSSPVSLAQIYLKLGETDRAFECLERGFQERDPWSLWNKVNPVFESVRTDPRFQELLSRIGLAP